VPGNHDKIGQIKKPTRYLRNFGQYPSAPPFRKEIEIERSKQKFILYGIDSNLYAEANIAVGTVTPGTLAWLAENFERDRGMTDRIKILLLHHHPVSLKKFRRFGVRNFVGTVLGPIKPDLTRFEEGERLLDLCRGNIHIICHGHEHFPVVFIDERSGCLIVSAGATSQLQLGGHEPNSFHALRFDSRILTIVQFDWSRSRFVPVLRWTYDVDAEVEALKEERIRGA
jgi:predicted phosphodiesterase